MISKLTGTLVFACIQEPVKCYEKEKGQEWKIGIVVDEDTADAWDEAYKKQPAKTVKTSEFEEIYNTAPPFPDEKKQYIITLKKNTKLANGEPVPDVYQPKVLLQTEDGRVDITYEKLVGNGSLGSVSVQHYENDYGAMARLQNVLVTELVEYEKSERKSYSAGSEFDDEQPVEPPKSARTKPAAKSTEKTPSKVSPKTAKKEVQEDSEDDPF